MSLPLSSLDGILLFPLSSGVIAAIAHGNRHLLSGQSIFLVKIMGV
ncbi:MAG TPA: hypothetical protein PKO34_01885 [Smithellaceae bacterium]|nr:hypothetical protein [Smithellaceae bacterium]